MAKTALPTIFLTQEEEERLYIAAKHLGISRTEFCTQAILKALQIHEAKYGGILSTGDLEIKASDKVNLPPTSQIGQDERAQTKTQEP